MCNQSRLNAFLHPVRTLVLWFKRRKRDKALKILLATPEGRMRLAQAMVSPRRKMDYLVKESFGSESAVSPSGMLMPAKLARQIFPAQPMPDGARLIYESDPEDTAQQGGQNGKRSS